MLVVADDFSGAAEVAGAAFVQGLSAEVHTKLDSQSSAQVVVVDSDTRGCCDSEVRQRLNALGDSLANRQPGWIYKKIDSVLRGDVLTEVATLMEISGKRRAVLCPANPSRGRVVRDGKLFIDGEPLHATLFAADPAHPAKTADVLELLRTGRQASPPPALRYVARSDPLPDQGVCIVEATSSDDLAAWAAQVDAHTLPAGGVEFFESLLRQQPTDDQATANVNSWFRPQAEPTRTLWVCGSAAAWPERQGEWKRRNLAVVPLPADPAAWTKAIELAFEKNSAVGMAVGDRSELAPRQCTRLMSQTVANVLQAVPVDDLLIEGGATASACVRHLGWARFAVRWVPRPGTAGLKVVGTDAPRLVIKPGSYAWPEEIWARFSSPKS